MSFLPYGHQSISEEDIQAVVAILRGDWLSQGPAVAGFEETVAEYLGVKHAVSFSNGTAALHGAMHAAGVVKGDKVITTPMTFAATSNSALYCGGIPLFSDISEGTFCLDPKEVEAVLNKESVRVVAPVSFAGYPVDIDAFRTLADKAGAVLIEDACQALGAVRNGHKVGFEADMTVFSFHPVKSITTGEGGMVATQSDEFAQKLRLFRSHGIIKDPALFDRPYAGGWDTDMVELGYNYRLTDIASALGTSQMKRLDGFIARRKEIAALYEELLKDVAGITLPPDHPGHAHHLFCIRVDAAIRRDVFDRLKQAQLGVQVHYVPVHRYTYYQKNFGFYEGQFPKAELFSAQAISIPIFPDMTDGDVHRVVEEIKGALSHCPS